MTFFIFQVKSTDLRQAHKIWGRAVSMLNSCGGLHLEALCFLHTDISVSIAHPMALTFCEKFFHRLVYPFGKSLADLIFK